MTNETPQDPTPDEVTFGAAPAPHGRARRTGRALTWVAVGAIGATVLTGVAFAATGSDSTPSASPSAPAGEGAPGNGDRGGPGHGRGGPGGAFGGLRGDVLHGEFVVKDGDSTQTILSQTGDITAVSSTELTVKSTDGFTATWTLSSSTKVRAALKKDGDAGKVADLKVGQTVNVSGTRTTSTSGAATQVGIRPTAAQLEELRKNAPNGDFRGGRPGKRGQNGTAPAPAPSATATSPSSDA